MDHDCSTMGKLKRKAVNLDTKLNVIKAVNSGQKMAEVAKKFNLSYSTVTTIWYAREKIESAAVECNHLSKKLKKPSYEDLDQALLKWSAQQRSHKVSISGPILKAQANHLASMIGMGNFQCSANWIERFKKRYNISFGKVCGAARNVDFDFVNCDEMPQTATEMTTADVIPEVTVKVENDLEEDDSEVPEPPPTLQEAQQCLKKLSRFYECMGEDGMQVYLDIIDSDLTKKQKTVIDFL